MTLYYDFPLSAEGVQRALRLIEHAEAWGIGARRHDVDTTIQVAVLPTNDVDRVAILLLYGAPDESLDD